MTESSDYEVYLADPGGHPSHVITLVQEVTGGSTAECAAMVHDAPVRIASYSNRKPAEDLVARFREFEAVAIIRRPGEQAVNSPPPPSIVPQPRLPVGLGLITLGVIQVIVALGWLMHRSGERDRLLLLGAGGLVLGLLALIAGFWKLRRDELD